MRSPARGEGRERQKGSKLRPSGIPQGMGLEQLDALTGELTEARGQETEL